MAVKDLNTFKVKTYRLSYSFAIFASKDNGEDKPTNSDSVKSMVFSSDPIKVYYDKSSKYITDIKVSSCITANKSSALFDGSEVTSQLVFFNSASADVSGLKIDGSTAVQTSSTDKDSSNNQYSHTLYIKSYKKNNITISGNNATYSFELKLTGVSTKDFPDSFRIMTVLKDVNGTEFASEGSVKLKKEKEPEKVDTKTNTSINTSTGTNTNTKTSTNTSTGTSTNTNTSTGTSTNTKTSTGTSTTTNITTNTSTNTGSSTETSSNTNTTTTTVTATNTSSNTSTETNTQTTTNPQTSTYTDTSSNTETNTSTDTGTSTNIEISVSISSTNSETNKVEVTTPIKITFNEKMDNNQNLLGLICLICNSNNLITASNQLEWSIENNKDVLTVKNIKLVPEQSYTIKLNSGLKTQSGLISTNQITSSFVTRDAVVLNITNLTAQNAHLNTRIEITPTGGSISSIENASINFNSNSKTGSFSIQNDKAYFTLTSGTTWNPATTYSGTISGILDGDGCETKTCDFSFTTRNAITITSDSLSGQSEKISRNSNIILITSNSEAISDVSNARITMNSSNISGSFSIQSDGKIKFVPSSFFPTNTNVTAKITGIKDYEGTILPEYGFSFETGYFAGEGTEDNPYLVSTADELNDVRQIPYSNTFRPYFKQINDIDLTSYGSSYDNGKGWEPLDMNWLNDEGVIDPSGAYGFAGIYNGNNYKITNLYINRPEEDSCGLFRTIGGICGKRSVTNLGIELSSGGITCRSGGALAGSCSVGGRKNGMEDYNNYLVTNCWVRGNGKITATNGNCGGLIGFIPGYGNGEGACYIKECYSLVNVEGTVDGDSVRVIPNGIGGLVGVINPGPVYIEYCYSTGTVKNNGTGNVGGLIAYAAGAHIKTCFSNSNVLGNSINDSSAATAGFVGFGGDIINCYSTGNVTGNGRIFGFIGNSSSCINCYSTGNIYFNETTVSNKSRCSEGFGFSSWVKQNCYSGSSLLDITYQNSSPFIARHGSSGTNCYAKKDMTIIKNDVSSQPGLEKPLPETVALDGVDGANLPDNPDWKNEIFKDGYENGESFDTIWEISSSGLPILKNMPGNPVQ